MLIFHRAMHRLALVAGILAAGSGVVRGQSAVPESQLETFLGLQQGDLTGLNNGPVMNGSAIQQTILVQAGATLSFNYTFMTNEPLTSPLNQLNPFAFITSSPLADFADTFSPLVASPAPVPFALWTGNTSFSETFSQAGTYNLGIGVVNVTDNMYSSGLLLDSFQLTGGTVLNGSFETGDFSGWGTIGNTGVIGSFIGNGAPDGTDQAFLSTASVPEPGSLVLMGLGCLGLGVVFVVRRGLSRSASAGTSVLVNVLPKSAAFVAVSPRARS